jgi:hypothetical protein
MDDDFDLTLKWLRYELASYRLHRQGYLEYKSALRRNGFGSRRSRNSSLGERRRFEIISSSANGEGDENSRAAAAAVAAWRPKKKPSSLSSRCVATSLVALGVIVSNVTVLSLGTTLYNVNYDRTDFNGNITTHPDDYDQFKKDRLVWMLLEEMNGTLKHYNRLDVESWNLRYSNLIADLREAQQNLSVLCDEKDFHCQISADYANWVNVDRLFIEAMESQAVHASKVGWVDWICYSILPDSDIAKRASRGYAIDIERIENQVKGLGEKGLDADNHNPSLAERNRYTYGRDGSMARPEEQTNAMSKFLETLQRFAREESSNGIPHTRRELYQFVAGGGYTQTLERAGSRIPASKASVLHTQMVNVISDMLVNKTLPTKVLSIAATDRAELVRFTDFVKVMAPEVVKEMVLLLGETRSQLGIDDLRKVFRKVAKTTKNGFNPREMGVIKWRLSIYRAFIETAQVLPGMLANPMTEQLEALLDSEEVRLQVLAMEDPFHFVDTVAAELDPLRQSGPLTIGVSAIVLGMFIPAFVFTGRTALGMLKMLKGGGGGGRPQITNALLSSERDRALVAGIYGASGRSYETVARLFSEGDRARLNLSEKDMERLARTYPAPGRLHYTSARLPDGQERPVLTGLYSIENGPPILNRQRAEMGSLIKLFFPDMTALLAAERKTAVAYEQNVMRRRVIIRVFMDAMFRYYQETAQPEQKLHGLAITTNASEHQVFVDEVYARRFRNLTCRFISVKMEGFQSEDGELGEPYLRLLAQATHAFASIRTKKEMDSYANMIASLFRGDPIPNLFTMQHPTDESFPGDIALDVEEYRRPEEYFFLTSDPFSGLFEEGLTVWLDQF